MADPAVCNEVLTSLRHLGGPVTARNIEEFRDKLDLTQYSKTEVKRAMGSLIDRGLVIRSRPRPEGITASAAPITIRLKV